MNIPNPNPDTRCTKPAHADRAKSIRRVPAIAKKLYLTCAKLTKKAITRKEFPFKSRLHDSKHNCKEPTITPSASKSHA